MHVQRGGSYATGAAHPRRYSQANLGSGGKIRHVPHFRHRALLVHCLQRSQGAVLNLVTLSCGACTQALNQHILE